MKTDAIMREQDDAQDLIAIQNTLQGNQDAFAIIVEKYSSQLYSLAYRMLGNDEEAEEAVQEIFLKAYKSLARFRLGNRFHPWLYTIALNYLRSSLRKKRSRDRIKILPFDESIRLDNSQSQYDNPEELLENVEGEKMAKKAIDALRAEYREVFILRQVQGLSVAEVSGILHIPEGTVKTYLHRARKKLIDFLTGNS